MVQPLSLLNIKTYKSCKPTTIITAPLKISYNIIFEGLSCARSLHDIVTWVHGGQAHVQLAGQPLPLFVGRWGSRDHALIIRSSILQQATPTLVCKYDGWAKTGRDPLEARASTGRYDVSLLVPRTARTMSVSKSSRTCALHVHKPVHKFATMPSIQACKPLANY